MKVFTNKREGSYSGGLIVVAANSVEEAHETFHKDERFSWAWDMIDDDVFDDYYLPNNWEEMPMLIANVDKPMVLAEEGYTE